MQAQGEVTNTNSEFSSYLCKLGLRLVKITFFQIVNLMAVGTKLVSKTLIKRRYRRFRKYLDKLMFCSGMTPVAGLNDGAVAF